MSILSSMYAGASGLNVNDLAIEIIGNNIANLNTVGYKAARGNFAEILGRTVMGNMIGGGASPASVERLFSQGAFLNTNQSMDLAIGGNGFFAVQGAYNGKVGEFYTRAGQFHLQEEGYMVNSLDLRLQGYNVAANGEIGGTLGDIRLQTEQLQPNPTSLINMAVGLHASEDIPTVGWDIANFDDPTVDETDMYNFDTTITVYDSLGEEHQVRVFFDKTADNEWHWRACANSSELDALVAGPDSLTLIGEGDIDFTTEGELTAATSGTLTTTFQGTSADQAITLDFGDPAVDGFTDSVQYEQETARSLIIQQSQDGYSTGVLQGVTIDSTGVIYGAYSNGERMMLGQVALAVFPSNAGLGNMGGNLFEQTPDSGIPTLGPPNSMGRGTLVAGALEQSNVDLAEQFVQMIASQRGYQASSRTITTADQMYQEVVNIKR